VFVFVLGSVGVFFVLLSIYLKKEMFCPLAEELGYCSLKNAGIVLNNSQSHLKLFFKVKSMIVRLNDQV
jgi:hypothetical protein